MESEEVIEDVKEAKLILLCNNVIELIVVITEGRKQGLFKNKFWDLENDEELDLTKLKNVAIKPVLKELYKQENMIEMMAEFIDIELSSEHLSRVLEKEVSPLETYRKDIKQYFEKKAEESE